MVLVKIEIANIVNYREITPNMPNILYLFLKFVDSKSLIINPYAR